MSEIVFVFVRACVSVCVSVCLCVCVSVSVKTLDVWRCGGRWRRPDQPCPGHDLHTLSPLSTDVVAHAVTTSSSVTQSWKCVCVRVRVRT